MTIRWLTAKQVAALVGVSVTRVGQARRQGWFRGKTVGPWHVYRLTDALAWRTARIQRGQEVPPLNE